MFAKIKKLLKWLLDINVRFYKWLWGELKDWRTLVLFIIVFLAVSCEIWVPALLSIITRNGWWLTVSGTCLAFWLGPFTPFWGICVGITLGIKALWKRLTKRKK